MNFWGLTKWQVTTAATLTVGYAGYYVCRSNLSVANPLLLDALGPEGLTKSDLGTIASAGLLFYAGGKLINGIAGDFIGGRRMFQFGMIASVCATVVFGLGAGFWMFVAAWCANRFVQSMGWGALVKTASRWFPSSLMGSMLGFLSLSYLFGDAIARVFLGALVAEGVGWRGVFFAAAGVLGIIFIISLFTLKSSPCDVGEEEPPAHPGNLYGSAGNEHRPQSLMDLLGPLVASLSFWLVCTMNFGLTLVRETFNFWTSTYLTEAASMSAENAAFASSLFPFFGGMSVLCTGMLSDFAAKGRRGAVMIAFLLPATLCVGALAFVGEAPSPWFPITLVSMIGFLTLGPYAFLTGVVSVDLGGKRGSATAAGLADTAGYIGGMISGYGIGRIAERWGWPAGFLFLTGALAVTTLLAAAYWFFHDRRGSGGSA